jgi:hypothetical protein
MGSESTAAAGERVQHEMLDEGRRLVDAARAEGLTLRLLGGLAVREHCKTSALCERDHSDLDMVAPAKGSGRLAAVFAAFGYAENYEVRMATGSSQLQFVRPCAHPGASGAGAAHVDDHVDLFLDTVRMDHDLALAGRLEIEPYSVSLSDLLLSKLQIFRLELKDLRDIVTLLGDADVRERDAPGVINAAYIGRLCADDWGLFYDVTTNVAVVDERAASFALSDAQIARVRGGIVRLIAAIDGAPKTLRWRLRARVGTRRAWHREVEDQE